MDNDIYKTDKADDEYHFSDTENNTNVFSGTGEPSKANIFERIKRKNILIAILVLIILFGIYKIADVLFSSDVTKEKIRTPVPLTKPIVSPAPSIQQQQPSTKSSSVNAQQTPMVSETSSQILNNRLRNLEANDAGLRANSDKLTSQINDLQNSLSNLNHQFSELSGSMQDLANKQDQLISKLTPKKKEKHHVAPPKPIYYVRAMIPGRAWLVAQDGSTISVSLGDNLPGYGVVQIIDSNQGIITTNSGAIIGYSTSDS